MMGEMWLDYRPNIEDPQPPSPPFLKALNASELDNLRREDGSYIDWINSYSRIISKSDKEQKMTKITV
jgi:hypothetical protein